MQSRIHLLAAILVALAAAPGPDTTRAQSTAPNPSLPAAAPASAQSTNVQSLEALFKSIVSKQQEVARIQTELQGSPDEVTRAELLESLRRAKDEADNLIRQFEEFAVAVDISAFQERQDQPFNWQEELGAILQPILDEIKNATSESRLISELRGEIEDIVKRHRVAQAAVANLETLAEGTTSPELGAYLSEKLAQWTQRRDDLANRRTALQLQLDNRLGARKSVLDSTAGYAETFVRTRGLNLLLGILGFCAVFFGIRWAGALVRRLQPRRKAGAFSSRLGALLFHMASVAGGVLAILAIFNLVGDWFLLGIVILFLLGVGWASIKTLPQQIETVKLMLNIGAVREGERLLFDGLPWKVDALSFNARLVNPGLDGGVQTLPVKHLVGLHSRPPGTAEEWFPCRTGDWVVLADGRSGRVAYQSPSAVQLVELGGSQVVYQAADFLAQAPRVLSTGFRIEVPLDIDYAHQAEATTTIPAILQEALETGLRNELDPRLVKHVATEFAGAGAHALQLRTLVDLHGDAAPQRQTIERAIHRLLVDACSHHHWTIPFPQLTLHQVTSGATQDSSPPARKGD
jgi:hypothetical protein